LISGGEGSGQGKKKPLSEDPLTDQKETPAVLHKKKEKSA